MFGRARVRHEEHRGVPPSTRGRGRPEMEPARMTRSIVFVSDFGLENEWVGICHAVMSRIAPGSRVIDLSHFVEPLNVEAGARLLSDSLAYLPADAILLAVVDPNVGKDRDIAVEAGDGRVFVGPDNGLLSTGLGGVRAASSARSRSPRPT